jgi:uncharacterized protein involved in exopolysaccharide biosynthesis
MKPEQQHNPHGAPSGAPHYGNQYGTPVYYGQAAYGGEGEDGIDLMRLIQVGLRRWETILLVMLVTVGLGVLYLQFATPIYRASSLMEMSVRKPRFVKESAVIDEQAGRLDTDIIFNTRLEKFQSRSMYERMATLYLGNHPEAGFTQEKLVGILKNSTSWSVRRKTYIVEVG